MASSTAGTLDRHSSTARRDRVALEGRTLDPGSVDLLRDLADLVAPVDCAGCGARGVTWCPTCDAWLSRPVRATRPDPAPTGMPAVWAVAPYAGPVRSAIVAYKDRARTDLAQPLGAALARSVAAAAASSWRPVAGLTVGGGRAAVLLVPVPSHPVVARARGGCHVERLSRCVVGRLRRAGVAAETWPALEVVRRPTDSAGLDTASRARNVSGVFRYVGGGHGLAVPGRAVCGRAVCGRAAHRVPRTVPLIVVVDDVVTTGATLAEATRALRAARGGDERDPWPPPVAAVVAATMRTRRKSGGHQVGHRTGTRLAPPT